MGPTKVAKPWRETENNALREGVYNNNLELRIAPLLAKAKVLEKDYLCRQKNGEEYIDKSKRRDIMKKIQEIKKLPQEEILKDTNEIDFFKLTRKYLPYRDEFECRIHWLNVLHPLVNQKSFSAEEDATLLKLAEKYKNRNWPLIAEELGTNRTPIQCLQRFQRSLNKDMLKTSWDKEADERLIEAVKLFGHDWVSVSSYVGDRSKNQCLFRWDKTLNPAIKRGKWSKEEDQALLAAVKKFGKGNWKKIKYDIPGRTDAQCRERYVNCLDPNINFSPFTPEEDQIIKDYVAEHGLGKWSAIAQKLVNRRDSHVWRRYKQIESEKYIKYQRNTLWKKKSVMNHFQSRGNEKPHYELKELNVKGTPEISYRESLKMEKMRRKLKRKGIDDDKILKHIARLHYEGKFSTHGMWIAKDNIKHKQTFKLVADVPPQQKYKGKIKDKLFVEISSLSEESDEETNSEVSENILKERDNNKKSYTRPSESFITAVTNAIYEANDPEKDLPLVACKEIMIQKIKKRIFFPPRPVEKHDGKKLHHYCKYILRKNDLRFEDAKSRLEKMMINTDIDRATNNKRKKIIQPYLDKLIGKHETFLKVSEMMVKQNNLNIILKKSVLKRRLIEIEDEENTSDVPFQKISNIKIKKEPIDSDVPSKRKKFKLKVSHRSQRSKRRNKKRTHTSRLLSKIQQGSFESDKEDDICESNSDDNNNIGNESPIDHSIVENEVVISNTVQEPVNNNHQNEDSQLRTFTLLLQALHVDTRKIMQTLPQAEQNTNLPDNNVDQNEDDIFPECFPLSPNVTTLGGFRTLLLHRRHLFNIVNKQYPPIFQTLPAVRDLRYRETRAYEALTKRFKSTFFWPSFLATFSPKYIQDTSSTSKEK